MHNDGLLSVRFQVTGVLGLSAQALHRIHHRVGLGEKRIADSLHPGRVLTEGVQHLRKRHQRLHTWVPRLVGDLFDGSITADVRMSLGPGNCIGDIAWIGGGHQHLSQQCIRIQRQRCQHLIKLLRAEHRLAWRGRRGRCRRCGRCSRCGRCGRRGRSSLGLRIFIGATQEREHGDGE
ncbi:hypothetical protein D3C78_875920 [compost metagenome]